MSFKFEELKVWQKALEYTILVYDISKAFPKEEVYGFTSQIRRASDSIALNIAEGSGSGTNKEFKRFLNIARRSALETVSCLFIAKRKGFLTDEDFTKLYSKIEEITKMISGLKNSLN